MRTVEVTYEPDPAFPQNWPCQRRIFAQRQVRAAAVVVVGLGAKHAARSTVAKCMVKSQPAPRKLSPNAALYAGPFTEVS